MSEYFSIFILALYVIPNVRCIFYFMVRLRHCCVKIVYYSGAELASCYIADLIKKITSHFLYICHPDLNPYLSTFFQHWVFNSCKINCDILNFVFLNKINYTSINSITRVAPDRFKRFNEFNIRVIIIQYFFKLFLIT